MKKRGQFSMEYLFLVALVISILVISVILYVYFSTPAEEKISRTQGRNVLENIVSNSEDVLSYGAGTRNKISVRVPSRVTYLTFSGREAFMRFDTAGGKTSDVVVKSNADFIERTYVNPPEGKVELIVGAETTDSGEVKICISEFEKGLDCQAGAGYVMLDAFRCRPGQMVGDLDDDGKISNEEGIIAGEILLQGIGPPEDTCCYDMEPDGDFDNADVNLIRQTASTTGLNDRTC